MAQLDNSLPPGLAGFMATRQFNQQADTANLGQMSGITGILAKLQAAEDEKELRAALASRDMDRLKRTKGGLELIAKFEAIKNTGITGELNTAKIGEINRKAAQSNEMTPYKKEMVRLTQAKMDKPISTEMTPYQKEMLRLRQAQIDKPRAPPQPRNLQLTTDEAGNQLIVNPDGTTRPLTREEGGGVRKPITADKPMTEFQGKSALYGTRAAQSDKVLKSLEDKISTTGLAAGQATGIIGNTLMSSEQRRVDQAQRDFVNAVLRQESGAVISDAEFANAKKQYFPQPGDDPNTVSQKRANRQLAVKGFSRMSGPKGGADIKEIIDAPLLPGVSAISPTPPQAGRNTSEYVETRRTSDGRVLGKKADGTIEEIK